MDQYVLGLDLDGVCADFYQRMREVVAEWKGVDPEALTRDVTWGLPEWGVRNKEEYWQIHRFAVRQRDLFGSLRPMAGARQVLRALSDDGVRIRIITHRLLENLFHQSAVAQTAAWLDYHDIPYADLCFMADKTLVEADMYVEDGPSQIAKLLDEGKKVIVFMNSTNEHLLPRALLKAADWAEVEAVVRDDYRTWRETRCSSEGAPA